MVMKSTLNALCKQNASQLFPEGKHEPLRKYKTIKLAKQKMKSKSECLHWREHQED